MNRTNCFLKRPRRHGFTMIELTVSAGLLIVVMTFVTTLCFQINLTWKDINHRHVAVCELSNQLEQLTWISSEEAATAVESLQPSGECLTVLRNAKLTGRLEADPLGDRIVLQIDWDRRIAGLPVELSGWLINANRNAGPKPNRGEANESGLDKTPSNKNSDQSEQEEVSND